MRIGNGYDVHRLVKGRKLYLGGVEIEHPYGLDGHSDADVAVHALMDALLGAAALGDIGKHFPPGDKRFKNADSCRLLGEVVDLLTRHGYTIGNIDIVIVAEQPKLAEHIPAMRENIAKSCRTDIGRVSVKATTEEGLGLAGEGIGAHCVCILEENRG
ncbi:MAG: 2-C-methyl-D-erythritol 2,4-cyclodiphosphate synthase [Oscillospiraceae bacterium]|nr:2-C-methyl-D-erythritol 2,4-cyclodiphosphate synthase [Oscillospiraceae bacterium]